MERKTFYKRCPKKGCRKISGFCLTKEQVAKNEKYICQDCQKESKLSKWDESSERRYLKFLSQTEKANNLLKIKKSGMTGIKPKSKTK